MFEEKQSKPKRSHRNAKRSPKQLMGSPAKTRAAQTYPKKRPQKPKEIQRNRRGAQEKLSEALEKQRKRQGELRRSA